MPPRRGQSELDHFRRSLPVYERQDEIVKIIKENRVVLVLGETGSGKTTQVSEGGSTTCWLSIVLWLFSRDEKMSCMSVLVVIAYTIRV